MTTFNGHTLQHTLQHALQNALQPTLQHTPTTKRTDRVMTTFDSPTHKKSPKHACLFKETDKQKYEIQMQKHHHVRKN